MLPVAVCAPVAHRRTVDDSNVCTDDSCDPDTGCREHGQHRRMRRQRCVYDGLMSAPPAVVCSGSTALRTADDSNVCTDDSCDPATGAVNTNNTAACDDGDACTTADTCAAGACVGGAPLVVDDDNVCTDDSCDPATGAVNTNNTASCDDADACTTADTCAAGVCVGGAPLVVDDDNVCTDDSCDPATGAVNTNNTASCDDADACTTADTCAAGACVGGASLNVDDGNACTDDSCDPATGAVNTNNTASCDDGDACTTADTCAAGVCVGGAPLVVDDGNVCTDDSCDPATGAVNTNNTAACDDADACTTADTCAAGVCVGGAPLNVDDGNVCTDDSCDPATGAINTNNTAACDDADACTTADTCAAGVCVGGAPLNVDDGNVCTDDSCDPATGAINTNNTASCDDGDACTTADTCAAGVCVGGASLNVDDGNACTDDSCDPATGAVNTNNTASCDDGDACTTADTCAAGVCVGGAALNVDDGNVCTDDSCDPDDGCQSTRTTPPRATTATRVRRSDVPAVAAVCVRSAPLNCRRQQCLHRRQLRSRRLVASQREQHRRVRRQPTRVRRSTCAVAAYAPAALTPGRR